MKYSAKFEMSVPSLKEKVDREARRMSPMIKVHDIVKELVLKEEESHHALVSGYMNLSNFAKSIQKEVKAKTKKEVSVPSIVVSLSRLQKELKKVPSLLFDIDIHNITAKSPLSEIVFARTAKFTKKLGTFYEAITTVPDDFLTMTLGVGEVTVMCSSRIKQVILKHFKEEPLMVEDNLAALSISFDPKYYYEANITYSLLRRIALNRIPLAETITTRSEIIFTFHLKYLAQVIGLFQE